ncbi:cytokine receptor family member b1 isoform X2 [Denticeps clupeoides]|uniref:cytokine receptor family member b1 isoform X2 n=1 Tax=Denticeps clupeoides TaxID=299321 RepID=UPI0010A3DF50|nr:uncharacterized protein LOC114799175 isoform X2 [Denticeps clupeoides]
MKRLVLLTTCLIQLSSCDLPAPTKLCIESRNFDHALHWIPGTGTPQGTRNNCQNTSTFDGQHAWNISPLIKQKNLFELFNVTLQARYGTIKSLLVSILFKPTFNNEIGPPTVTLKGCGTCLEFNITLPRGKGIEPKVFNEFCNSVSYEIHWRKAGAQKWETVQKSYLDKYKLDYLSPGQEYCIKVEPISYSRKNLPSQWLCAFTSKVKPPEVMYLVVWVIGTTLGGVGVIGFIAILVYTGSVCSPKMQLPAALNIQVGCHFLTPESTEVGCAQREHSPTHRHTHGSPDHQPLQQAASYQEEMEESEDDNAEYIDRPAKTDSSFFSHYGSEQESSYLLDSSATADEGKEEEEKLLQPESEAEDKGQEENAQLGQHTQTLVIGKEDLNFNGDVNLFSVTLGGGQVRGREEKESEEQMEQSLLNSNTQPLVAQLNTLLPLQTHTAALIHTPSQTGLDLAEGEMDHSDTESECDDEHTIYLATHTGATQ